MAVPLDDYFRKQAQLNNRQGQPARLTTERDPRGNQP